jgi:hypothetical protein
LRPALLFRLSQVTALAEGSSLRVLRCGRVKWMSYLKAAFYLTQRMMPCPIEKILEPQAHGREGKK